MAQQQHGYHTENKRVAADLVQVLQGTLTDQITGRTYIPERNCYRLEVIKPK